MAIIFYLATLRTCVSVARNSTDTHVGHQKARYEFNQLLAPATRVCQHIVIKSHGHRISDTVYKIGRRQLRTEKLSKWFYKPFCRPAFLPSHQLRPRGTMENHVHVSRAPLQNCLTVRFKLSPPYYLLISLSKIVVLHTTLSGNICFSYSRSTSL